MGVINLPQKRVQRPYDCSAKLKATTDQFRSMLEQLWAFLDEFRKFQLANPSLWLVFSESSHSPLKISNVWQTH